MTLRCGDECAAAAAEGEGEKQGGGRKEEAGGDASAEGGEAGGKQKHDKVTGEEDKEDKEDKEEEEVVAHKEGSKDKEEEVVLQQERDEGPSPGESMEDYARGEKLFSKLVALNPHVQRAVCKALCRAVAA